MITTQDRQHVFSMQEYLLNEAESRIIESADEYFLAGFLSGTDLSIPERHASAIANYLRHCPLRPYQGELLYPANGSIWNFAQPLTCWHHYVAMDIVINAAVAEEHLRQASTEDERLAWEKAARFCRNYPRGGGWTHSIINFGRLLAEGLDAYAERIQRNLAVATRADQQELYRALLVVVEAIDVYRERVAAYLAGLTFTDPAQEHNRQRLAAAYASRLPFHPAQGFYEAMVATTFLYAIDGSDDLGRFDQFMWPYYREDIAAGKITRTEARELIATLWSYVDACDGWNTTLAGSTTAGQESSNDLTILCLEAAHGRRRPNLAIRLREDTPDEVWDAVIDTLATGSGLPALYSEENYLRAIDRAQLNLPDADARNYAFGGCTELMIHGCSNVGSLDGDFSVIKALDNCLPRLLPSCATFAELMSTFKQELRAGIAELTERINAYQETRAAFHPQLIRTLFIDDCIDRGKNYQNGGARYNWSIINIVGLSNTIDALAAVSKAVYKDGQFSTEELLAALHADFAGFEEIQRYLQQCPRFGNDDPTVDTLAHDLSDFIYREFKRYAPWRGGRYLCGTLMFTTYGWFGHPVGATPDGRQAGTPVADSAGPVQGRDRSGPTAMLRSVTALQQQDAPGTLVVNIRLARELFTTPAGRQQLKALIRSYFHLGGMQLQVNVVDQVVLRDAIAHPERHGDLIVRVGGYSEYFNALEEKVKIAMLERTEHC